MTTPTATAAAPHPTYGPPLTDTDMPHRHYRVPLSWIGEDGDTFLALGHVPPLRMVAACHALERTQGPGLGCLYDSPEKALADVRHRWAITRPRCTWTGDTDCPQQDDTDCLNSEEAAEFAWYADWNEAITADTPGAFPVTILGPA